MNKFTCFVPGKPETQGSTRAFVVGKRAVVTSDNKRLKPWRQAMHCAFYKLRDEVYDVPPLGTGTLFTGPVCVVAWFVFPRLASHPKTAKGKQPGLPPLDLDKLQRAVGDALTTAGVVSDDRIIGQWVALKRYGDIGEPCGVHVEVTAL